MDERDFWVGFFAGMAVGSKAEKPVRKYRKQDREKVREMPESILSEVMALSPEFVHGKELRDIAFAIGARGEGPRIKMSTARHIADCLRYCGYVSGRRKIAGRSTWVWAIEERNGCW